MIVVSTPSATIRADRRIEWRQLRRLMVTIRAHRGLLRRATSRQRLRYIGNAYPEQLGYLANPLTIVRCRENPIAQILRIIISLAARGLAKNTHRARIVCGLANLIARRQLLRA